MSDYGKKQILKREMIEEEVYSGRERIDHMKLETSSKYVIKYKCKSRCSK